MKRLLSLGAILAIVLSGIFASTANAKQPSPFRASVAGTLSPTGPGAFALEGTGQWSLFGDIENYSATVQITGGDTVNGPIYDTLTETLTAANGDTITLRCKQVAYPESPGSPVLNGTDKWKVISGTGVFAHASGSGTGHTHANLATGEFTKEMTGTLAY